MKTWYAVHTHAHAEEKAVANLHQQGFVTYLPRYLKVRRHARRVEQVSAPLFPRYLFALVDDMRQSWGSIRSTIGVCQLVSNGSRPVPVAEDIISSLRERENDFGFVSLGAGAKFEKGEKIRIVQGPLGDCDAIFDCMSDTGRVFVLLDLLGRQVKASVSLDVVSALS